MDAAQDPLVSFYQVRGVLSSVTAERQQDALRRSMELWHAGYV